MKSFPYETATSRFPVVNELIQAIKNLPIRDWANTVEQTTKAVVYMADENGFKTRTTPEERAVASALKKIFCGPRTAHYGWRLYMRYRQGGRLNPLNITY